MTAQRPATALLMLMLMLAVVAAGVVGCGRDPARPPLTVFAAASLKGPLDEAARVFEREHGTPVRIAYAGTPALARQIGQGAPADVFVSADREWMDELASRALVDRSARRDVLANTLVLVAPAGGAGMATPAPGADPRPLLDTGRLAVASVDTVPAGRYARQALRSLGMWAAVEPRLAQTENVRAALLLVARGEAPLGIVYASDAQAEPRVRVLARFPPGSHQPIVYPAARVASSTSPHAGMFVDWLASPRAQAVFRASGFAPLP